ncbi:hypothetical protein [Phascolarctobacterium succinatutens]|jgi:iron uptake system EfeUOB component EfeO/EfeM|uniref:hypothetical protein n=1 Tax=Phascolarctobacterium succinatutens TaxID=626940 RepID=UPI0026EF8E5B|nr:hypothetical protein [Phascolarctobacterium succinatutens]
MRKLLLLLTCLLMCCSALALAANKTKAADDPDAIQPMETISAAEMNERLQVGSSEDLLYVKIKEDMVEVYQGLATDRSLRKQLILTMPNTEMLRLYTNNKATFAQINKMLSDYESSNANFNGYKIITDKDTPKKLENGGKIYRLWFMKIEREKQSRRGGWNFPIGIGIGIGGGHHHGPWIGVGW